MATGFSPKLPLAISELDGAYALNKSLVETVKQNLKMLVLTSPGERIMDPQFGAGLRRVLFENNTPDARDEIAEIIKVQVAKYLPFIELINVGITSDDANYVHVGIRYTILPLDLEDILSFTEKVE